MNSRELVIKTLEFENVGYRAPRNLWCLPWAATRYPDQLANIRKDFPDDFTHAPGILEAESPCLRGEKFRTDSYVDDWGCEFQSICPGMSGEVKTPIIASDDLEWNDLSRVHFPVEWLAFDRQVVRDFYTETDRFVITPVCPRPFERLQFLRGTEMLYMDLMDPPQNMLRFMERMHAFYCELLEEWCRAPVDAIQFMDDWGAQKSLLINPSLWQRYFAPMYREYIAIAHRHGKKAFMHSDGNIEAIYPYLTEMGLDALNSQLFCMNLDTLSAYRGKITFWGEIDRQHLLPDGSAVDIESAVESVYRHLWRQGGCVAQCEFGPGARPENVYEVFKTWDRLTTA